MSKTVQIDEQLFWDIVDYIDQASATDYEADRIRRQLDTKVDKMISRYLFSQYKRQPTGAEREAARRAYLDHRCIPTDYRTDTEYSLPEPPEDLLK